MSRESEGLFAGLFARGGVAIEVGDRALVQAMLDVELALARALTRFELVPRDAAEAIAAAADGSSFDLAELGRGSGGAGTPVPALVSALRQRLPAQAAEYVHFGATSQDIVDTALMLVARRAMKPLVDDLVAAADACAGLADRHRVSIAAGRTLLQHAVPVTFGLKAAHWMAGIDEAIADLVEVRDHQLAVSLGGAAGTLAAFGRHGPDVASELARQLGLAEPTLPWHTARVRPARLACALGLALGTMGKVAGDVILLAQTEVAEVSPVEGGGSSAMPHKRNPVAAIAVAACARRGPGLVATILGAMPHEHERAAGAWQAEWEPLLELLRLTGSAASSLASSLAGLGVDPERMGQNLELTHGLMMSESAIGALGPAVGRSRARELVAEAADRAAEQRWSLRDALLALDEVTAAIDRAALERALEPAHYLGAAEQLIDRALSAHRAAAR